MQTSTLVILGVIILLAVVALVLIAARSSRMRHPAEPALSRSLARGKRSGEPATGFPLRLLRLRDAQPRPARSRYVSAFRLRMTSPVLSTAVTTR